MTSQVGFVIALVDACGNANGVHYTSVKSRWVKRSVLAAEFFAAIHALDFASTLRAALNELFQRIIPVGLYRDSKCLFDSSVGLNSTLEKRQSINLFILLQSYELHELTEIVWIPNK